MTTLTTARPWPLQAPARPTDRVPRARSGQPTILVLGEQPRGLSSLTQLLASEGFGVERSCEGPLGLRAVYDHRPDLILVEAARVDAGELETVQRIRELCETPVMVVGAARDEAVRVAVFRAGADDHLDTMVSSHELLARVKARLRRTPAAVSARDERFEDACLHVDFNAVAVRLRAREISLSPTEFRLLTVLVRNAGSVLSPEKLLDACWSADGSSTESVRVYIGYLRKKLGGCAHGDFIQTVRGFGYRYIPH